MKNMKKFNKFKSAILNQMIIKKNKHKIKKIINKKKMKYNDNNNLYIIFYKYYNLYILYK